MLDERHKENNLTRLKIGNTVLSRCLPFPKVLLRQIVLFMELQEMLRLRDRRRPDLSSGGHLWHLQRPLLGDFLGGGARVLALTHQAELFTDLGFQVARLAALTVPRGLRQKANGTEEDDAHEWFPFYRVFTVLWPDNHANGRDVSVSLPF